MTGSQKCRNPDKDKVFKRLWRKWNGLFAHPRIAWLFAIEPEPYADDPEGPSPESANLTPLGARQRYHDEITQRIRQLAVWLIGVCLFCVVTLFGTTDADILRSAGTVELPVLNYTIGLSGFLVLAPLSLVALTIYLHLFVGEHRRYSLPTPSARPMVANFRHPTAQAVTAIMFYAGVPATLGVFVWKMWPWSMGLNLLYAFATVAGGLLLVLAYRTERRHRGWLVPGVAVIACAIVLGMNLLLDQRSIDLRGEDLKEADLRGADLKNSRMQESDLSRAQLNGTKLGGANLTRASLREIDGLRLQAPRTVFPFANLQGADLRSANLEEASLFRADLRDANLQWARLKGANLYKTNLRGADMRYVRGLMCLDLWQAENWHQAIRSKDLQCGMESPRPQAPSPHGD